MFSATRATTVVSQPPRFSISSASERLQAQPGLLDGVVGLGARAQHAVGDGPQMGAVLVEAGGQEVLLVHLVTFLVRGGSGH